MSESNVYDLTDKISNDEQIKEVISLINEVTEKYGDNADFVRQYILIHLAPKIENSYELLGFLDFFKHILMKLMVKDPLNPLMAFLDKG